MRPDFGGRWPQFTGGRYSEGQLCCKMTWVGFAVVVVDRCSEVVFNTSLTVYIILIFLITVLRLTI